MNYKGFEADIEIDEDAGVFHGEVINTRDVITFQGKSVNDLKQAFADAVEDYFAFCASRNEERKSHSLASSWCACRQNCIDISF